MTNQNNNNNNTVKIELLQTPNEGNRKLQILKYDKRIPTLELIIEKEANVDIA